MDNLNNVLAAYNRNNLFGQAMQRFVNESLYSSQIEQPKQPMKFTNEQKVVVDAMKANGESREFMLYILGLGGNLAYQYGKFKELNAILARYIAGEPDLEEK